MEDELSDGDIVWVKVSNSWWPGEVMGDSRLSEEFLSSLRKKPLAVVKFFQEDSYEYVKNPNFIFKYNCPRKNEFLRKGLEQYRAKMKHMEKFPSDVMHAERVTGGDPDIVNLTDFQPQKKERYSGLFQDGRSSMGKGKSPKEKPSTPSKTFGTPISFGSSRKTMHEVRILAQPSSVPADSDVGTTLPAENVSLTGSQSLLASPGQVYHCYKCNNYSANRQNLIMLHIKHCRASYTAPSGLSSSSITTPTVPTRKVSYEKMDESAEDDDLEPESKIEQPRRPLPTTSKTKSFGTPFRNVEQLVPSKVEPSSEKRTRGGRKTTALSETHKHKKTARRRNKRSQSPEQDEDVSAVAKLNETEDNRSSVKVDKQADRQEDDGNRRDKANAVSVTTSREESTLVGIKNNTDVKLKNELLADWSEDEQEEDEGAKGQQVDMHLEEDIPAAEQKIGPPKDSPPVKTVKPGGTKKQQKETKQESMKQTLLAKKATKMEAKNDASTVHENEETGKVEEAKKDLEGSLEDSSTVAAVQVVTVSAISSTSATTIAPTAATVAPTSSPHATIKYRNIPKKQKREFVEVTNDDVSMVQEKHTVPSREGSTASSSSTTGSNELCIGNSQSSAPALATERPISAKQLILNRATRGSSKSLSGDENTTTTTISTEDGGSAVNSTEGNANREQKSQLDDAKKKTESSCFDFNEDEEERQQQRVSHTSTTMTMSRLDRKLDPAVRQKSIPLDSEAQEADRDVKLSQEIDSLLCEMDVPKLPEALSDVMAVVSDKIDCNRTLPPKERGKRIFKTRNKTVVTTSPSLSPNRIDNSGEVIPECINQAETVPEVIVESHPAASTVAKEKSNKKQQTYEEEKRIAKDKNDPKKEEDHQNPSVTSSAMTEEMIAMDVDQQQSAKKNRKSDEVLLPDSSGNGDAPLSSSVRRQRGKVGKSVTETTEKPSESASSSRKSKRNRRDVASLQETTPPIPITNDKDADESNITERVSKKMVTNATSSSSVTTATVDETFADGNTVMNEAPPLKKQSVETVVTHSQPRKEESVLTKKTPLTPPISMASKPTATDLQVAEALINLPVTASVLPPVTSSSSTDKGREVKNVPMKMNDAGEQPKEPIKVASSSQPISSIAAIVGQNAPTTNSSSSLVKSINPRKRHLQSMMLTTTETTNPHSKTMIIAVSPDMSIPSLPKSTVEDETATTNVAVSTKQDSSSIPEKNKQNESTFAEEQTKVLTENDKFDINNMPIVMDDSELLVDEMPSMVTAAANSVIKGVNGGGSATKIESLQSATMTSSRDKRQTTMATVKGSRPSKEQIVITSKGTVLTASTTSVSVASKFSSKPSVSVTSAITLGSSSRPASTTSTLPPNGSQQTVTTSPPKAASPVTTQLVAPKIILAVNQLHTTAGPYGSIIVKSDGKESCKPKTQDRRASGDDASSSVSSSSGSDGSSKKSHRVLRLTPQKLKEFSRLGYIEDRQGKGKMLTKSGMRQLYGKQAHLKQLPPTTKKKAVPISTKLITTTEGADVVVGSNSTNSDRASLPEVASSGSSVVIAAAADSSVQESSATTVRTVMAEPSVANVDEEEEILDQHNKVSTEMELPASSLVAPSGATILLESSPSSSGTGPAEVILGSTAELTMVGGSMTEASSSSGPSTATGSGGVQESSQLVAVTAENFGGPPHLFYLCSVRDETFVRVNDELLYLDASNQLVALPEQHQQHPSQQQGQHQSQQVAGTLNEDIIHQAEVILPTIGSNGADLSGDGSGEVGGNAAIVDATGAAVNDGTQQSFLLNTQDGQHIILDQQSLMALAAGGDASHIITADGQQIVLQETAQEWLAALSASQQQQQTGTVSTLVTPEGTQIIVAHENAGLIELQEHPVLLPTEIMQVNPNTTIETNAVLTKPPIMSTVEVPTKNGIESASRASEKKSATAVSSRMASSSTMAARSVSGSSLSSAIATGTTSNLDETLAAVIGHVPSNPHVPTSLELPITVTNPVIAKTSTASSRINAALFPLTTTATTVSSLADTIPAAAAAVVLVSGAEVSGTIDRVPSTSSLADLPHCSSPISHPDKKGNGDGQTFDDDETDAVLEGDEKPYSPTAEPTIASCTEEDDIQIPNTPESQHNSERHQQQLGDEFSDDGECEDDAQNDTRNHLLTDEDEANSNCSEIIAIQPNVVVLDAALLLNSPPNDDGIDDEMENDSEEEEHNEMVVQERSFFEQQPLQQPQHRSRNVAARSTNGGGNDGRPETLNLAEHHNSSNNDSGIDTSGAVCEGSASSGAARETGPVVRRTIVER
uniref:PWWP domain-containing protein n=1 Tax=Anopheles funestus TaxID=62324 RepID=A0A182RXI9_ANOFN